MRKYFLLLSVLLVACFSLTMTSPHVSAHTAGASQGSIQPFINSTACHQRNDLLQVYKWKSGEQCYANAGGTNVNITNVTKVCGGKNHGWFVAGEDILYTFTYGQCIPDLPRLTVSYIDIL